MEELREKIAKVVFNGACWPDELGMDDVNMDTSQEIADAILAIPEIAEALEARYRLKTVSEVRASMYPPVA